MIDPRHPDRDSDEVHTGDRADAEQVSREELITEADQFLDLSGADPETHDAAPQRNDR